MPEGAPLPPPPLGMVMVAPPCGCGCGCRPPCGCGCVWGGFENEKLRFDCAGASGSRVNVYKSHHSLTETFSQHIKGNRGGAGGAYHSGGDPELWTLTHIYPSRISTLLFFCFRVFVRLLALLCSALLCYAWYYIILDCSKWDRMSWFSGAWLGSSIPGAMACALRPVLGRARVRPTCYSGHIAHLNWHCLQPRESSKTYDRIP